MLRVVVSIPKRNPIITAKRLFIFRFKSRWWEWRKPNWYDITLREFRRLTDRAGLSIRDRIETLPLVSSGTVLFVTRK